MVKNANFSSEPKSFYFLIEDNFGSVCLLYTFQSFKYTFYIIYFRFHVLISELPLRGFHSYFQNHTSLSDLIK